MTAETAPSLQTLAAAALRLLEQDGADRVDRTVPGAPPLSVQYRGPRPAAPLPGAVVAPADVPRHRPWVGAQRLTVRAPLIVFDIAWNAGEPLRIMTFSRGDWEAQLLAAAT
ncbi:MAG: hypothetical protein AB7K86_23900 [Rhodospirillales bacterium]